MVKKQAFFAIENPLSTILWLYTPMEASFLMDRGACVRRQKFLQRHGAYALTLPLGQYGGMTEQLVYKERDAADG